MQQQKRTFLLYSRGLMPSALRLGSLYVDPVNPLEGEDRRFVCPIDDGAMQQWIADIEVDEPCVLTSKPSRDWLVGAGLAPLLSIDGQRTGSQQVQVEGSKGRRVLMNRPTEFLNKVIMQSPEARRWLAMQLSISRALYYLTRTGIGGPRQPRVWLVTGVQYISNAQVKFASSSSSSVGASVTVPVLDPVVATVTSALGVELGLSAKLARKSGSEVTSTYSHADERVWSAQFTQLKVKYIPGAFEEEDLRLPATIALRKLVDLPDGHRTSKGERLEDEVALVEGVQEEDGESAISDGEEGNEHSDLPKAMLEIDWNMADQLMLII